MTKAGFESLPGTPLRPGSIVIPAGERSVLASVLNGPVPLSGLHPLHAYIAMQRGIGESIADLCGHADYSIDDGPMMGSLSLELTEELLPDIPYRIEGEIVDLVRKEGRRFPFDLLTYRERMIDPKGREVATATNTFVLPRPKAAAS